MKLLQQFSDDLETLVSRASPAVVGVEHARGHGTGLFLTPDGYVLTNRHVVMRGSRKLTVQLSNGEELRGSLVGGDAPTDLAVVRAEGGDFPTLPLAAPETVRVGQLVMAIGNPFRLEQSVALGVVSAVNRSVTLPDGVILEGMLQTDAAINPGNSGGPLINTRGEVVGLNTLVLPYAQGIGFAVSATTAAWVASLLIQRGKVERRFLGIAAVAVDLTPEHARDTGQPRAVRILRVQDGTPADDAGLQPEDLLLAINRRAVGSVDDLQRLMALATDEEVSLDVLRKGRRKQVSARTRPRIEPVAA
ncbi:trypsin-like peptidase domain-containing protein [Myxococcus sp. CA056]|uniref:S1C family serine protease n=1 Tax=unclassified Myxococcus TaxID=2648731 RepID=UPI00157A38A7|nr:MULTISPECIES: trypsin-like peptidase domain-containing protein [unclassified Myxococcus]NTX10199.1 trypsin-like peptidase domain-containing protein [Myxococcus sp. CA056]NTX37599.1 trypsin-like peptidase domain-containing protein [Myxococcus sp. CA033]NTX51007.1 trypsin-like peptidase domain-containing protein [Myxococcus sp. CA039A]